MNAFHALLLDFCSCSFFCSCSAAPRPLLLANATDAALLLIDPHDTCTTSATAPNTHCYCLPRGVVLKSKSEYMPIHPDDCYHLPTHTAASVNSSVSRGHLLQRKV